MKQTVAIALLVLALMGGPTAIQAQTDAPKPITLELNNSPVQEALTQLLKKADVQYLLKAEVTGKISVRFKDLPFETALTLLLKSGDIPLTYEVESGVYIIRPRTVGTSVRFTENRPARIPLIVETPAPPPIALDFKDTPVRKALEYLFSHAKAQFSIDNEIQGTITVKSAELPFDDALAMVLRASKTPLTYVREGRVYIVRARRIDPSAPTETKSLPLSEKP